MEKALLKIEFPGEKVPGTNLDRLHIVLQGSPVLICKGISAAMAQKQDICAAIIAGVVDWCKKNDVYPGDLGGMVQFYK